MKAEHIRIIGDTTFFIFFCCAILTHILVALGLEHMVVYGYLFGAFMVFGLCLSVSAFKIEHLEDDGDDEEET